MVALLDVNDLSLSFQSLPILPSSMKGSDIPEGEITGKFKIASKTNNAIFAPVGVPS